MRILILFFFWGAAVAAHLSSQRIIGGHPTSPEKHPFMAAVLDRYRDDLWLTTCGGTLINNRVVVSAAHCFYWQPQNPRRVRFGSTFGSHGGAEYTVQTVITHHEYSHDTLDNDIAVLWTTNAVAFTDKIKPARIAGSTFNVPDGALVTAIGFGMTENDDDPILLREVSIYTVNHQTCIQRHSQLVNWPDITQNMLCAGLLDIGDKGFCSGDSGGPLIYEGDILVGVVSWNYSCGHRTYPEVFARVSALSRWIVANANAQ